MRSCSVRHALAVFALGLASATGACESSRDDGAAKAGGACADPDGGAAYPAGVVPIELLRVAPDLRFEGIDAAGRAGTVALRDFHLPCATDARLLVVRVGAAWCGSCLWSAAHTTDLLALDVGPRLELLDLVVGNEDNAPPSALDLAAYRALVDAPRAVAADPAYVFGTVNPQRAALPLVVLIDRRTMRVESFDNDPSPHTLEHRVRSALASLDGAAKPILPPEEKHDGRFTKNQWEMIRAMTPVGPPPPDPTNAKADDPAAAALGKELFSDVSLSPSGTVACATCHDQAKGFSDGLAQSKGVKVGDRNAPSVALASHARWQFWDGRADSLWMQALGPFENEAEVGGSRLHVVHRVHATPRYRASYEAVFGPLPPLEDGARFPPEGKPGDARFDAMAEGDREAVTRAYVNVGKSIAAFERTLRVAPNALDRYAAGELGALTAAEKDGLLAFFKSGCAQCHFGPRLTNDAFHAIAFPTGRGDKVPDRGRIDGAGSLLASEFSRSGRFSDVPRPHVGLEAAGVTKTMLGAFKTPTLRGLPTSGPYGHGGTFATLEDVMKHYGQAGSDASRATFAGTAEPWLVKFDEQNRDAITGFLRVMGAEPAQ